VVALQAITRVNEFTEMTQHTDAHKHSGNELTRHSIIGQYCPGNVALQSDGSPHTDGSAQAGASVDAMSKALQSAWPVITETAAAFALATTGSTCQFAGGGIAVIAGRPFFRDQRLADLAQREGDAAALASGYETYSHDIFTRVFGAFCCVIIDPAADRVLIAIDRLGQHSMYYHTEPGMLSFGSFAAGALRCSETDAQLLHQGVYNYVYFHMVPSPGSVYQGTQQTARPRIIWTTRRDKSVGELLVPAIFRLRRKPVAGEFIPPTARITEVIGAKMPARQRKSRRIPQRWPG
jgi:hypothetical protein